MFETSAMVYDSGILTLQGAHDGPLLPVRRRKAVRAGRLPSMAMGCCSNRLTPGKALESPTYYFMQIIIIANKSAIKIELVVENKLANHQFELTVLGLGKRGSLGQFKYSICISLISLLIHNNPHLLPSPLTFTP